MNKFFAGIIVVALALVATVSQANEQVPDESFLWQAPRPTFIVFEKSVTFARSRQQFVSDDLKSSCYVDLKQPVAQYPVEIKAGTRLEIASVDLLDASAFLNFNDSAIEDLQCDLENAKSDGVRVGDVRAAFGQVLKFEQ